MSYSVLNIHEYSKYVLKWSETYHWQFGSFWLNILLIDSKEIKTPTAANPIKKIVNKILKVRDF